jgi:hypothetical protein
MEKFNELKELINSIEEDMQLNFMKKITKRLVLRKRVTSG